MDKVTDEMALIGRQLRAQQRAARYGEEAIASDDLVDEFEARAIYLAMHSKAVDWQPIETAPKDEWVVTWSDEEGLGLGRYCDVAEGWGPTTHWKPLPGPPRAAISAMGDRESA